jgi:hypothetical protein
MAKTKSRSARWSEAVTRAQAALDEIRAKAEELSSALDDLESVRQEYEEWKGNLPENLQSSALGEKLETVSGLDFESGKSEIEGAVDSVSQVLDEAEGADLPQGFGRD